MNLNLFYIESIHLPLLVNDSYWASATTMVYLAIVAPLFSGNIAARPEKRNSQAPKGHAMDASKLIDSSLMKFGAKAAGRNRS